MKYLIAIVSVFIVVMVATLCYKLGHKPTSYLYNAYSPEYDETFVLKSCSPLRNDTLVHFDDNVVATNRKTPYTARIISLYTK